MAECMGNMLHITDRYIDKHESLGAQHAGWMPDERRLAAVRRLFG